jgi:glutamyl-tRNA reductase
MKINPEESFEDWAKRVQQYEYGHALQRLAEGNDIDTVFEAMAMRIQQKLMHPIFIAIKNKPIDFDIEASKKAYEEAYLNKNGPKPDHLTDD